MAVVPPSEEGCDKYQRVVESSTHSVDDHESTIMMREVVFWRDIEGPYVGCAGEKV